MSKLKTTTERLVFEQAKGPVIQSLSYNNYPETNYPFKSKH